MKTRLHHFVGGVLLALVAAASAPVASAAGPRDASPLVLIVSYHTTPANRVALRNELEGAGLQRFEKLQSDHAIAGFRLLFNRHVDTGNWDALAIIRFAGEADAAHWKDVERESPGGLTPKALSLTTAIETFPADPIREKAIDEPAADSVFVVIPYEYSVLTDEYVAYLDDYVLPQTNGWIAEGVLRSYRVYLARYPAARPWQSVLVLEYRNDEALGRRDAVVAKVRAALRENAKWKAISDSKKNVRSEKPLVIGDEIAMRRERRP